MKNRTHGGVIPLAMIMASCMARAEDAARTKLDGLFPPDVRTVGIVLISSPFDPAKLSAATNALSAAGYRANVAPNVPLAHRAPPAERARLLTEAWLDPQNDILWFARGGDGAADVVPLLDWERLRARPDMRVVGFSDVTLLLNAMLAKDIGHPLSGPMVSALSYWNQGSRDGFAAALRGAPLPSAAVKPLRQDENGAAACGLPMGGHLERVHRLFKMGLLPPATGRVVFLECTAKYPPGQIRQCLEELRDGGAFAGASAVVFCDFRHTGADREEIDAFLPRFAATLPCPAFSGYPYGHCPESRLIDFRRAVSISADGVVDWNAGE